MHMKAPSHMAEIRAEVATIGAAAQASLPLFLTSAAAIWAGYHNYNNVPLTLAYTLFAYLLALLGTIDARHGILPHLLTGTLAVLGLALAPTLGHTYLQASIGGIVAVTGLFAIAFGVEKATAKQALGGGDLWLTMALGIWLGAGGLPMLMLATAVTGLLSIRIRKWLTQNMHTYAGNPAGSIPFGPALCLAGWLALLYTPAYWQGIQTLAASAS